MASRRAAKRVLGRLSRNQALLRTISTNVGRHVNPAVKEREGALMFGRLVTRRRMGVSIVLAGCLAAVGATWAIAGTSADITHPTVIKTMEVGGFGQSIDLGAKGPSVG